MYKIRKYIYYINYDDENQNFSTLSELQSRRSELLEISDETKN